MPIISHSIVRQEERCFLSLLSCIFIIRKHNSQHKESKMTTVASHRENHQQGKVEQQYTKNVLKNKQNNQANSSKPQSKQNISEEKQYKPNMRRSIEKAQIEQNNLLAQKKGIKADAQQHNNIRNIIQNHGEQYKQSKPFHKKYGTQNVTHPKNFPLPLPQPQAHHKQQKQQIKPLISQAKNKTKESFNKKLINNIIKDEEAPSSKHSYRIKKVDNRSPKKIRDDLITINEEEHKLQMEILELHKSTKQQLEQSKQTFQFNMNNLKKYFPEVSDSQQLNVQEFLLQVADKFKHKKKEFAKIETKIEGNAYVNYLKNIPEDIMELHSSEQQDEVDDLPDNRPRLQNNIGSYSSSMPGLKDKKHGLNMRRTYDVFKDDEKQSRITHQEIEPATHQEQKIKQQGQNKMTVNYKLKDFLLS